MLNLSRYSGLAAALAGWLAAAWIVHRWLFEYVVSEQLAELERDLELVLGKGPRT